jgi:hypothetical protein
LLTFTDWPLWSEGGASWFYCHQENTPLLDRDYFWKLLLFWSRTRWNNGVGSCRTQIIPTASCAKLSESCRSDSTLWIRSYPDRFDGILLAFIRFSRIPRISRPESDHRTVWLGYGSECLRFRSRFRCLLRFD